MTPTQIKTVVDAVFAELEVATATMPFVHMAVHLAHALVDNFLLARVAAKLNPPA